MILSTTDHFFNMDITSVHIINFLVRKFALQKHSFIFCNLNQFFSPVHFIWRKYFPSIYAGFVEIENWLNRAIYNCFSKKSSTEFIDFCIFFNKIRALYFEVPLFLIPFLKSSTKNFIIKMRI